MLDFDFLSELARSKMSDYRYNHTLGVVRAIEWLGEIYMPRDIDALRAAAFLHDIAKEMSYEEQLSYLSEHGVFVDECDRLSAPTLHQLTGAAVVRAELPTLDPRIAKAIEKHSTADADMSLFDELLYIADYIEDTRTNAFCIELRAKFLEGLEKYSAENYIRLLDEIVLYSLDKTMRNLTDNHASIHRKTFEAENAMIEKLGGKVNLVTF